MKLLILFFFNVATVYSGCFVPVNETDTSCSYLAGQANKNKKLYCAQLCEDYKVKAESEGCNVDDIDCIMKDGCFPAEATVVLDTNQTKRMDQLKAGDKVAVGHGQYSEVYFFSTQMTEAQSKFISLTTSNLGSPLTLTGGHFLYVNDVLSPAQDVKAGDVLTQEDGSKVKVLAVSSQWSSGLFNPHTMHGDIIVDGILTSTYTTAIHPTLAHALLSPLRALKSVGISFDKPLDKSVIPNWILDTLAL